ncbi:shikimate kinase [Bordetella avium]|nr:shikimate kinase [Bordetella avium]WQE35351.1 shikimate kinase [Bordetella avium]
MMGAGKTTIGRGLARALGREFIDLDHELEARCGVRVPVIFEIEGEAGFRKRESTALQECTQRRGIILATGGGAVLAEENRRLLRERGIVLYLRASVDELFRRTSRDRNRPLLATADPRGTLNDLMIKREPLYKEVADLVIETGAMPITTLIKAILPKLQAYEKKL